MKRCLVELFVEKKIKLLTNLKIDDIFNELVLRLLITNFNLLKDNHLQIQFYEQKKNFNNYFSEIYKKFKAEKYNLNFDDISNFEKFNDIERDVMVGLYKCTTTKDLEEKKLIKISNEIIPLFSYSIKVNNQSLIKDYIQRLYNQKSKNDDLYFNNNCNHVKHIVHELFKYENIKLDDLKKKKFN